MGEVARRTGASSADGCASAARALRHPDDGATRLSRVNVLAIDQGTSASKALVVGADGVVLGEGTSAVTPRFGADGAVEQDPVDSCLSR